MKKLVLIVNGRPKCGKTTMEMLIKETMPVNAEIFSSIDCIKELAPVLGWDGVKDAKGRRLLSDIKDATSRYNDLSFNTVCGAIDLFLESDYGNDLDSIMMIDVREPREIKRLVEKYGCKTVKIVRNFGPKVRPSNHADEFVDDYEYDNIIYNNGGNIYEFRFMIMDYLRNNLQLNIPKGRMGL